MLRSLQKTYLSVDPRSLGLFRIGLGLVLLSDLFRRYQELEFWYTNEGLLPNHTLLWRPPATHVFSLFFLASSTAEATFGFAVCAAVFLLFTLGYRTRVMQLLALICRVSLNSRLAVLENGGDMVMNLLCIFSLALPLGERFSVDAWLADRRSTKPVVSLAMLGLILQFAAIYLFNASSKQGHAWRDGSAVHYALHLDKYATGVGVWMREHLPIEVLRGLSWGTLVVEWTAFALIITPLCIHQARALAILVLPFLHVSFALGLNLGGFSPAMIAFYPLLLSDRHWAGLERWFGRRTGLVKLAERVSAAGERLQPLAAARLHVDRRPVRRWLRWASEGAIALLIIAITFEALNDNTTVPQWLRPAEPAWAKATIEYPRLLQGWRMFAPTPPELDSMIHVDATTSQGVHVDPYNLVSSRHVFPNGTSVPRHMDQSQFFTMYTDRIAMQDYAAYRQAFLEWLLAYPQRTGKPSDCLVSFDVYYVTDHSPAPGSAAPPTAGERTKFMTYTAPADGPCKPTPPPSDPLRSRVVAVRTAH